MLIISIILVVLFVGATIYRTKQIPESISAMVYAYKGGWHRLGNLMKISLTQNKHYFFTSLNPDKIVVILSGFYLISVCSIHIQYFLINIKYSKSVISPRKCQRMSIPRIVTFSKYELSPEYIPSVKFLLINNLARFRVILNN